MCRKVCAKLRAFAWIYRIIPFDESTEAHRVIGGTMAFHSLVHCFAHIINFQSVTTAPYEDYCAIFCKGGAGGGWHWGPNRPTYR
jgi:hypothetical protein